MKKLVVAGCAALALCAANAENGPVVAEDGIHIAIDQILQRYPWNGLVDIDYTVAYDQGVSVGVDDCLEVTMIDKDVTPAVTNRAITFLQAPLPMTAGRHRITWDANADGVKTRTDRAEFRLDVVHYAEAYMVIDVSGGPTAKVYPTTFVNRPPEGGFNTNAYKGDKIVLRRIRPGSYVSGSPADEEGHPTTGEFLEPQYRVTYSKPFYIGIFEITQKQYENVMGAHTFNATGAYRPAEKVSYFEIRGTDAVWPADIAADSFLGRLLSKCKAKDPATGAFTVNVTGFDLPTEYQWEYACRAGTTGPFSTTNGVGRTLDEQMTELSRYKGNATDSHGYPNSHTVVGSYLPNAWGLYDMHGNVFEWCRDWFYTIHSSRDSLVDYEGPSTKGEKTACSVRSGTFGQEATGCRSAKRTYYGSPDKSLATLGFRLFKSLP